MARRHRTKQRDLATVPHGAAVATRESVPATDHFRHALLGGAAALLVARPLVPSDGGAWVGDGQVAAALWLSLAALWVMHALGQPRLRIRFGWIDAAMIAFVGWWSAAALIGAADGALRPSINMLWEGVTILLTYLLLRQLIEPGNGGREIRAIVAVMVALGVVLAVTAIYQYFVTNPATRQRFIEHPAAVFREAQIEAPAPGSREFRRFADRLNSPEPTATFSLTNSLAAFLAPWLVIALGIAIFGRKLLQSWRRDPRARLGAVACAIPIAFALALTRSRSAWIGAAVGFACLVVWRFSDSARRGTRLLLLSTAALLVVILMAVIAIAARPQLFEPAKHSFQVRLDYWRASRAMIADRPWWGCGPGNFADYYTQYKLPAGTEEIRDPHNFALEIAASAGLPALALFAAVLAGFASRLWRNGGAALAALDKAGAATAEEVRPADGTWWILGGAILGIWAAIVWRIITGFPSLEEGAFAGTICAGSTCWLLWPWIRHGHLPSRLFGVATIVLLVALLAVGGMTFGGVNETLWLLLALGLNATDRMANPANDHKKSLPWSVNVVLLAAVIGLWVAQRQTAYEPTLGCQRALDAARSYAAERDQANMEHELLAAADADPYAVEPRRLLAQLRFQQWQHGDKQHHRSSEFAHKTLADFENWMNQAIQLEPRAAGLWAEAGVAWQQIFKATGLAADGRKAVEFCRQAAELYPTGVAIQLELAETLSATGDSAAAKAAAREALRLDDVRSPAEQALDDEQRKLAERIILGDNQPAAAPHP